MATKRLPRPGNFNLVNYPRVPCGDRKAHIFHDYRAQAHFHDAEDGWYHCCGVGPASDRRTHKTPTPPPDDTGEPESREAFERAGRER